MKKNVLILILLASIYTQAFSQSKIVLSSSVYKDIKSKGQLIQGTQYSIISDNHPTPSSPLTRELLTKLKSNRGGGPVVCSCLAAIDSTFNVAEFTDGTPPEYRSDDGSTAAKTIPFNFCLYGTNYTQFYINNNGNITLDAADGGYSATGFPFQGTVMLAPFWADVDTDNPASGLVYYKITPTYVIVQWNQVGYYGMGPVKLNTFQVIITDGSDPILPGGDNVAFCYGDMQWTTGYGGTDGFGDPAAAVGINSGDGLSYIQFGRFNQAGIAYDGGFGNSDGVDFLDNQSFYSDFCSGSNMAPIADGLLNCDTIKVCGSGDTLYLKETFLSPEAGQNTNIAVSLNGMSNATVISNTSGNTASVIVRIIASPANAGNNVITFLATDNGTPIGSNIINANVYVDLIGSSAIHPVITGSLGFCSGASTVLSVSPTTYDSYVWSTVSSDTSIIADTSGLYFVTAKLNGCSKSTSVNVHQRVNPTPLIAGYPFTCHESGYTTTLYSDSLIYTSYHWSNTSANDTIIVGNGTYSLVVTDAFGCKDSTTTTVAPNTVNVSTSLNGSTITANITNVTYQWVDCNNGNLLIAGATNQTYSPTINGNYAVVVSNGFCNDTSACVLIAVGIAENSFANSISISPNPFTSQTIITFSEEQKHTIIKIVDIIGKEIKRIDFAGKQLIIEKGNLSNGIYFVQGIDEKKNVFNRKIVVQ